MASPQLFETFAHSKLDLSRCHPFREEDFPLATGVGVTEEGFAFEMVQGGLVQPCTDAAGRKFAGINKMDSLDVDTFPIVEELEIPAAAPFTLQLGNVNIVVGQIRVHDITAAADMADAGGAPADNEFDLDEATGILTFNAADAGHSIRAYYKFTLTAAEFRQVFHGSHINKGSVAEINRITLLRGPGTIYTAQFSVTSNFDAAAGAPPVRVTMGAGGLLTAGGNVEIGSVVKSPSADDPYLGVMLD